jgi:hypothetical protein
MDGEVVVPAADGTIGLVCPDDESAKDYAREVVHDHDIELWQGERWLESFKVTAA